MDGDRRSAPAITVIIVTRNRPRALSRALDSISKQTLSGTDFEAVVVDDGSEPPVECRSCLGNSDLRLLRLSHIERSAARNAGAAAARANVLVFLDDDMLAGEHLLGAHLAAHREWPAALAVGSIALPGSRENTPFGRFRSALESAYVPVSRGPVSRPNFATAANMSISRDAFLRLGGFSPTLVSSEDQDLAMRHSASGGTIVFLPEAAALHDDSVADLRAFCRRQEWGAEKMVPFLERYPDWSENRERIEVNGPARLGEPLPRLLRKGAKRLLATSAGRLFLFSLADAFERFAPESRLLPALYRLAVGVHLQRGFRRGWARRAAAKTPARI